MAQVHEFKVWNNIVTLLEPLSTTLRMAHLISSIQC